MKLEIINMTSTFKARVGYHDYGPFPTRGMAMAVAFRMFQGAYTGDYLEAVKVEITEVISVTANQKW